jgi:hypothetical protein
MRRPAWRKGTSWLSAKEWRLAIEPLFEGLPAKVDDAFLLRIAEAKRQLIILAGKSGFDLLHLALPLNDKIRIVSIGWRLFFVVADLREVAEHPWQWIVAVNSIWPRT